MGMPWTDRVDAVKTYVFDANGNVAAAHGYTLPEAVKLTRSTDPSQQEAALLLIAAVLFKAIDGLQAQLPPSNSRTLVEPEAGADVDWQAVWTYAVGPGLELTSSLRLALDDPNMSVVVACAKALYALLSCAANETIFSLQESIWPGNKTAFTAPVFRRKTELDEGFIGGGRWRYHVSAIDLYPASQLLKPLSDTEEDRAAIGDEAAVTSKDIAAGLLRKDILSRIQYIFEKEESRSADENLLCVVIALAHHSPAAAKAVMKCPRLMDTIVQRFLLDDDNMDDTVRSAYTRAIQLIKILSQANGAHCIRFAETGALQVAQSEIYKQGLPPPTIPRPGEESFKGTRGTLVECLRLWRVCINNNLGIALFSDIYPTLCRWLAPLSSSQIVSPSSGDALLLAQESYSLLERLAWTLPVLPTQGLVHMNWTWQTALPLVEMAAGWLSQDRIQAVCVELATLAAEAECSSRILERSFRMKLVATMASVFHFLATVFEMFSESETVAHPIVNQLAAALACNNIVAFGQRRGETMLGILLSLWERADEETSMTASSCMHGLVRLLKVTDMLQSGDGEILSRGLVTSADGELRELLSFFGEVVMDTRDLQRAGEVQPAPGLGLGWGQEGGGVWSKRALHLKGIARIVIELLEILPLRNEDKELMWRHNCCIRIAGVFGPGDGDMVYRMCSNVMLHPEMLALVFHGVDRTLKAESSAIHNGSHHEYGAISKMLLQHFLKVWMRPKPDNAARQGLQQQLRTSLIATKLSNLSEESAKLTEQKVGKDGLPTPMMAEWAKQRLPFPPHFVFSPMMMNLAKLIDDPECKLEDGKFVISQDKRNAMEDIIERGVAWLLGLEIFSRSLPGNNCVFAAIPVARKLHCLSTLFLLGGDVFTHGGLKHCVSALQRMYGTANGLDFEGEVDGGYCAFVDALATKFSFSSSAASSSSALSAMDAGFARQVALYLRQDVAVSIRLRMWQALAQTNSLHLLPPLSDCSGDPSSYLSPSEKDTQMIEAFVSAWASGALDGKTSVATEIALHHIAAVFFEHRSAIDEAFLRSIANTLFGMSNMELLRKFLEHPLSGGSVSVEEVNRRLSILDAVGEGDETIMNKVRELGSERTLGSVTNQRANQN